MSKAVSEKTLEMANAIDRLLYNCYQAELFETERKGKTRLVIDYKDLVQNIDLAEYFHDNPKDFFTLASSVVCSKIKVPEKKDFHVRIKNFTGQTRDISSLREEDLGSFVTIEGMIKQKSEVKPHLSIRIYECPDCGASIPMLMFNFVKHPSNCPGVGCNRKKGFRVASEKMIDVYSMKVEEASTKTGSSELASLSVACRYDLADVKITSRLLQGGRVRISGIFDKAEVHGRGGQKTAYNTYLEANYIEILDDNFTDLTPTEEELKEFKKIAEKDAIKEISSVVFHKVLGHSLPKKALTVQMFGGVTEWDTRSLSERGVIHILLVGDGGTGKSLMLECVQQYSPKCKRAAGPNLTGPGLRGTVAKSDDLIGTKAVEAGILTLANKGQLLIDELDKTPSETSDRLHQPMESLVVDLSMNGVSVTMPAETAILAAANPKFGNFASTIDDLYNQVDMTPTLIDRFDFIFPLEQESVAREVLINKGIKTTTKSELFSAYIGQISDLIAQRKMSEARLKDKAKYSRKFIHKYINYAKKINPKITEEAREAIKKQNIEIQMNIFKIRESGRNIKQYSNRDSTKLFRLSEAIARAHLSEEVKPSHIDMAAFLLFENLKMWGENPDSGLTIETYDIGGVSKTTTSSEINTMIIRMIREYEAENKEPIHYDQLKAILSQKVTLDEYKFDQYLEKLKEKAEIYEPRANQYKVLK